MHKTEAVTAIEMHSFPYRSLQNWDLMPYNHGIKAGCVVFSANVLNG